MSRDLHELARQESESLRAPLPDLHQVRRRAQTLRIRGRVASGIVAAALTTTAVLTLPGLGDEQSPSPAGQVQRELPPEGRLLLQIGRRVEVLDATTGRSVVDRGVHGFDLSETGRHVAATVEVLQRGEGVSLQTELVVEDTETGSRTTVTRAGPRASIGDPAFSPDGTRIAFTLSTWPVDGALNEQRPSHDVLCTTQLENVAVRCFRGIGRVFSFDWSPTGDRLVAAGPGDQPVYVVNAATGDAEVLLPSGGTQSVRAALSEMDGYSDRADQFILPKWSSDGRYVAATASVTPGGWVPVVVDASGEFVASGQPNPHGLQMISWSPTANLLAHSTGYNGIGPPDVTFGLHVLDVRTGETRLLHTTNDRRQPAILGIEWSPSGRWLAVDNALTLDVVDAMGRERPYTIDLEQDDPGDVAETLQDWSI